MTTQEISRASRGMASCRRRVRELRAEGWPIETHLDANDLKPGQYRLVRPPPDKPPPSFTRRVSQRLRAMVLDRNHSVCMLCGATPEDTDEQGRRMTMHVDHINLQSGGGEATLDNLRTLCRSCNQGAKHLLSKPPDSLLWLKGKVRTASTENQRAIYDYLKAKFEKDT